MMNKLKIAFVDHTPFIGGAQLCLARHLKHLNRRKIQPIIITDRYSKYSFIYQNCKVPVFRINFERLKRISVLSITRLIDSVHEFNALMHKLKVDLVVANTTRALVVASLSKKNFKLVCYIRDYEYPKWLIKLVESRVDKFLMVSKSISRFYGIGDRKSQVIYLGSDMEKQLKKIRNKAITEFLNNWGIKRGDFVVGFSGRLVDWKGVDVLVEAIKNIPDPKVKLLIFGSGDDQKANVEEKIKQSISNNQLEKKIKLVGFIKDSALIYKVIDVFVLPSKSPEPFSTSMIEAAMAKLPIIATSTGGTGEFVKNRVSGILVEPNNSDQIAKALIRLKRDKKLARRVAGRAKKDSERFSESSFARKLETIYMQ